ncbi:MAG: T9SS type A sorting domain-containing protein [Saprospiraceae bacterium]|nr:T9SS type A sorting domain-containing protein [Saprospiraceae bacterium]
MFFKSMPVIALMMFLSAFVTQEAQGQCTNPFSWTNYIGIGPSNRTGIPMTDACVKAGEYLIVDSVQSGKTYFFASSVGTDFLTVHYSGYNGPVLATGTGFIVYANPYNVGPLYVHINTDASCETEDVCRAVTAQCISCTNNCVVSPWGTWSECSAACGGGTQTRTRSIIQEARNGGAQCPALSESRNCNTQPCPNDCVLSDWGPWSECSVSCGGGTRTRTRTILVEAQNGGAPCGALSETEDCNTQPCNDEDSDCDGITNAEDVCPGGGDNGPCNATTFPGIDNIPMSWRCGNNNSKVKVCHEGETICVAQNAVQAHLNHGDFLGPCSVCVENRSNAVDNSGIFAGNDIKMELFPNPTDGVLMVHIHGLEAETAQITVMDELGRIVFEQKIAADTHELQLDFAKQNLSSGKYLVRVTGGQGVVTQLVVFNSKD